MLRTWLFFPSDILLALAALLLFGVLSYASGKIDFSGTLSGILIGICLFLGGSWVGLFLMLVFFVLGTLASSWKKKQKQQMNLAQESGGKRSAKHAFSNAGIAALMGLLAWRFPESKWIFLSGLAGCFSSALGDTLSSELGNLYGRRFFDLQTFGTGRRGEDGVISLEGSLLGWTGSLLIGLVAAWGWNQPSLWIIVGLAGIIGNLSDSLLGAFLQRKGLLNNDSTNFFSTVLAAISALLMALLSTF